MRKSILFLLLSLLSVGLVKTAFSQDDQQRTLIGTPTSNEQAINVVADNSGNTYVGGIQDEKGLIVKQNALHQTIWAKTLRFTSNTADEVSIGFLDILGDTLFGCGKIHQGGSGIGSFYFKMNAQTGTMYWSKYETSGENYFSGMRYANGKYFLIGGSSQFSSNVFGRAMAVSSQTGQIIWQTPKMKGIFPSTVFNPPFRTMFLSSTEMVNGKMYITGLVTDVAYSAPFLIGINENGTIFLQKYIDIPNIGIATCQHSGVKIELDQDQNLILAVNNNVYTNSVWNLYSMLIKCDTQGNIIFAKQYLHPSTALTYITGINETPTNYVLYGYYLFYPSPAIEKSYALKVSKNGNIEKAISISKPNVNYLQASGDDFMMGNSTFINGKHYFPLTEYAASIVSGDINQIILDEELNMTDDCSELNELILTANDVPVSVLQLGINTVVLPLSFSDGLMINNLVIDQPCTGLSLDLEQHSNCGQTVISAHVTGFIVPTFYWSDGTVSTTNTHSVNTSDTLSVRVLDTKCCELFDTIVPTIVPSAFSMSLPADTSLCLQNGASYTINPTFSGANAPVQYLWSDNSTGASLAVTTSGTYWVEISDSCLTLRDSIIVTMNTFPVIGNTANVTVCESSFPVNLNPTVSTGATVLWDDNSTSIPRSVSGPGSYTISAANNCGTATANIVVSQTDLPEVMLVPLIDTCIQNGQSVMLSPIFTGTTGILWSNGSTGNQLSVSTSGTYTVLASNSCGTDSASAVVTINHFPELNLPATLDTCFEIGVGFSYTAQGSVGSYQWNTGSQSATTLITQEGVYSCTLTNVCGSITDSISISKIDLPEIQLDSLIDTCIQNGTSILLSPIFTGTTNVLWSDGSTGNQLSVVSSGTYTVFASNACGTDSATCSVTINYFPELDLPAVLDTCFEVGVGFSYTAQGSGGSYQWNTGSQTATEWISQEGIYSCILTNVCGSTTDSMQVRRYTTVDLVFPEDSIRDCQKQLSVSLLHVETNYNLEIFTPDGDLVGTHLTKSGWYRIHAFNPCGEIWDSIYVNLQNEQFFYLPNTFSPNGDTHNERYVFQGENITVRSIRIFNRWGEEIFSQAGDFTGWDGTYKGETCPTGMYAVSVIYEDCFGIPAEFNGHVNLLR